jgi:hypothetical protein
MENFTSTHIIAATILLTSALCPTLALGEPAPQLTSEEAAQAYRELLTTEVFAGDRVGPGAELSDQVRAFRVLMRQPEAARIFRALFRDATHAGKLYALCGLYHHDRSYFTTARAAMRPDESVMIQTQFGCMRRAKRAGEIIESHAPNAIRLSPGQTVLEWLQANGGSGELDIVGGGYPTSFAG